MLIMVYIVIIHMVYDLFSEMIGLDYENVRGSHIYNPSFGSLIGIIKLYKM